MSKSRKVFFIGTYNALFLVIEVMPEKFLNYLPVAIINNLLFVSMYTRQVIFKKFKDIYCLSTGFTSAKHCYSIVQKTAQQSSFFKYHFDYEDRVCALLEKFKTHLSLFSVCMYFLRCIRSCERAPNSPSYCKVCSRVQDFHFNCRSSFQNIQVTSLGTTLLGLGCDQICDLDVFVSNADVYFKFFKVKDDFCSYFARFSYPEEIFAAFSSILIRIYVNVLLKFFAELELNTFDEKKVRETIMTQSRFFLARFWYEVNIDLFMNFLITLTNTI